MKTKIISLSIRLLIISCFITNAYSQTCTGTPDPGVAISTLVLCNGSTGFSLKTSQPLTANVTGQWEESTNGTSNWTNIPGATTNPYNYTGSITPDMYYRFKATCTTSGSAYSNVTKVTTTPGNYAFGINEWNVYGFNSEYTHTQYQNINQTFNNYQGYYTQKLDVSNDYGFNTTLS